MYVFTVFSGRNARQFFKYPDERFYRIESRAYGNGFDIYIRFAQQINRQGDAFLL